MSLLSQFKRPNLSRIKDPATQAALSLICDQIERQRRMLINDIDGEYVYLGPDARLKLDGEDVKVQRKVSGVWS